MRPNRSPKSWLLLLALLTLLALPAAARVEQPRTPAEDPHAAAQVNEHATADEQGEAETHGAVDAHGETDEHGEAAGHGDAHGDGHGEEAHGEHIELPHLLMVARALGIYSPSSSFGHWAHVFENTFFAVIVGTFLVLVASTVYRRRTDRPGRLQAFVEIVVEQLDNLVCVIMGPQGRHYTPFIGTIFVYLLCMNYFGMVPLGKAPTSTFLNNFSIAIIVFLYVQYTGIRRNGIKGYLHHLAGSPKDATGWALSPLMVFLEVFGEFIKPVSLSLRLFGNIFGEDMLLAIFALLGVISLSFTGLPVGIPLHLPFMFLSLLLGMIQALVFSLLSTVYISLMLPHGDHGEEGAH